MMKQYLIFGSLFLCAILVHGQSAQKWMEKGMSQHKAKSFDKAIKSYSKALELDSNMARAWFNRGTSKLAQSNFDGALADFNEAIARDSLYTKAYFSRATVFAGGGKHPLALADLNTVLKLNDRFRNGRLMRGQVYLALQKREDACTDFNKALEYGDPSAPQFVNKYCLSADLVETWNLPWDPKVWTSQVQPGVGPVTVTEYRKLEEPRDEWTAIGTVQKIEGITRMRMDKVINMFYKQTAAGKDGVQLELIEQNHATTESFADALFKITVPAHGPNKPAEVQLWYVLQAKTALFSSSIRLRSTAMLPETATTWTEFFRSGKIEE